MNVTGTITQSYSGRGGFPSGPYFDVELYDEHGRRLATTRARAYTQREAWAAARKLAKRRGWFLTRASETPAREVAA
jgi:hypothetical protein